MTPSDEQRLRFQLSLQDQQQHENLRAQLAFQQQEQQLLQTRVEQQRREQELKTRMLLQQQQWDNSIVSGEGRALPMQGFGTEGTNLNFLSNLSEAERQAYLSQFHRKPE